VNLRLQLQVLPATSSSVGCSYLRYKLTDETDRLELPTAVLLYTTLALTGKWNTNNESIVSTS
jgi:hypothetical protein